MTSADQARQTLLAKIIASFQDVPYPGDDHLLLPTEVSESPEVRKEFTGKTWREISPGIGKDGVMHYAPDALDWLSPEAFRYYLPAYLIVCVEDIKRADVIPEILITRLSPLKGQADANLSNVAERRFEQISATFSQNQKNVIGEFFQYLFDSDPEIRTFRESDYFNAAVDGIIEYWDIK